MSAKAMMFVAVLAIAANAVAGYGNCTEYVFNNSTSMFSNKTCPKCQWGCLTNKHCNGIGFVDVGTEEAAASGFVPKVELPTFDCGLVDASNGTFFTEDSEGLCVLITRENTTFIGGIYDVQEQPCYDCAKQCWAEKMCSSFYHNYVEYNKNTSVPAAAVCPKDD